MPNPYGHRCATEDERKDLFWAKVSKKGEDECWPWLGSSSKKTGHGGFWNGHKWIGAHVFSFIIHFGTLPKRRIVTHTCNNGNCVNPKHLQAGTYSSNTKDAVANGTYQHNNLPKFKDGEIWLMRRLRAAKVPIALVAKIFKCCQGTVSLYCPAELLSKPHIWNV